MNLPADLAALKASRLYSITNHILFSQQPNQLIKLHKLYGDELIDALKHDLTKLFLTAASTGNIEIMNYMMNTLKLDIDIKDHTAWTPLHHASYNGNEVAVIMLLHCGADPKAQTAVNKNTPAALAKLPYFEYIFNNFDTLTREEFTQKYLPKIAKSQSNTTAPILNQDNTANDIEPFPIMDLPVELRTEIYDRLSIISSYTAQLVNKEWRNIYLTRFSKKYPYLGTSWRIQDKKFSIESRSYPTAFHFLLSQKNIPMQCNFVRMASSYDSINRALEKLSVQEQIYNDDDETMKFDPRAFKQFLFRIARHAETIYMERLDKTTLTLFISDVHQNYGIAFYFRFIQ